MKSNNTNLAIGIIAIIAGILVIVFPNIVAYVIGLVLIAYGVLNFL
ncbi:MAG: hypothetical protein ISP01_06920 [Methanobrevibacter arboriphilus]|jgi:uncharacterized membrane protein HdeD (DUF308 family)|uniref:DUF3096 domain-containing protein n=3 Tax=Methanobrevibacter arboriphilus TaxID=39441 RepID=A0A1V6N2G2_METAZ|nr:hypothetical protein [Methanobrevibacter arboriphilus]MBF4469121.1 hypothetical protein [Methanobrevibacter arboriphilus]MCC7561563.1 hypothetical protein [Methanobrevibacter arboriphilus]OQD58888.1 hypothetical protein MBBAR_7c00600 [Methanobrevibacter arboriphilus JCM 13429 = DSM 1125]BBL63019.1 hypothetical protein MarbSA_20590 [Methanobrevibacter arboriphilus]GLI12096.1 hypothetical protein MARBORIA2_11860 [Methanobrevibacter arboriphilus]